MYVDLLTKTIKHVGDNHGHYNGEELSHALWVEIEVNGEVKKAPFTESGAPTFNTVAFNKREIEWMRKAYWYVVLAEKYGYLKKYKPRNPKPAYVSGRPTFDTRFMSPEELKYGALLWDRITGGNKYEPKGPPFEEGQPQFDTKGFDDYQVRIMREAYRKYENTQKKVMYMDIFQQAINAV
jgi:hypothetical protein